MICLEAITILVSGHFPFLNNDFLNLGGHADFLSLPDIGFQNLIWLRVLVFLKASVSSQTTSADS
jgi:hypothetical protein